MHVHPFANRSGVCIRYCGRGRAETLGRGPLDTVHMDMAWIIPIPGTKSPVLWEKVPVDDGPWSEDMAMS